MPINSTIIEIYYSPHNKRQDPQALSNIINEFNWIYPYLIFNLQQIASL